MAPSPKCAPFWLGFRLTPFQCRGLLSRIPPGPPALSSTLCPRPASPDASPRSPTSARFTRRSPSACNRAWHTAGARYGTAEHIRKTPWLGALGGADAWRPWRDCPSTRDPGHPGRESGRCPTPGLGGFGRGPPLPPPLLAPPTSRWPGRRHHLQPPRRPLLRPPTGAPDPSSRPPTLPPPEPRSSPTSGRRLSCRGNRTGDSAGAGTAEGDWAPSCLKRNDTGAEGRASRRPGLSPAWPLALAPSASSLGRVPVRPASGRCRTHGRLWADRRAPGPGGRHDLLRRPGGGA